ncbi:J domain-containing protein [Synechococcus sp. Cruz-9H2]|uniref:J domain-containing protein n=1 Tax=unclassified Synechococcus TaxID=2626047 RepID=UPI0020CD6056|nr:MULTISPECIES: J domain-containing protein [unclassified Synechococcus]MCP9820824.1 J domain-containing protein [Synechococcus sp. Cruz-9H2]MCP9845030.1 J domain-containing protein [Synechococcus sp. Edmonson 11F2]MCP9857180.1 J domain-containing protein [Synechococcus sp. Cruz-9C9]MCP9864436.1 J domain-containing protein [Synechococcus sp. Cruz-7E5]MCP9871734.1 J domain-containing protein [Synechococcus sp. Cruz-7B9]
MKAALASSDFYAVLGVPATAAADEIKAAYRALVKRHHPDAGGDDTAILAINAAWAVLGDGDRRRTYDISRQPSASSRRHGSRVATPAHRGLDRDGALLGWLQQVYGPIDRLLAQVINPFPGQLRALAADPYDDSLMEAFCTYLEQSRSRMDKVEALYRSIPCPSEARGFGLSLYHCLSQVQDALLELERYTLGYVDRYLHDGREMLREAKQRRSRLKEERRSLDL